jgi:hypothetical protein
VVAGWEESTPRHYGFQEGLQIPPVGRDDKGRGVAQVGVVTGWEESTPRHYASQEGLQILPLVGACDFFGPNDQMTR